MVLHEDGYKLSANCVLYPTITLTRINAVKNIHWCNLKLNWLGRNFWYYV